MARVPFANQANLAATALATNVPARHAAQILQPAAAAAPAPPAAEAAAPAAPQQAVAPARRTLVVGAGISVQGTVQDAERLVVQGTVEASMIHAAELSIAEGGVFKGEVEVQDAEVAGTIDGTLTARGNLTVRATGRMLGTARCRRLQVEDGGQITGRIEMLTDAAPAETAPAETAPAETNHGETPRTAAPRLAEPMRIGGAPARAETAA